MATTNVKYNPEDVRGPKGEVGHKGPDAKEVNVTLSNPGEASVKKNTTPTVKKLPGKYNLTVITY